MGQEHCLYQLGHLRTDKNRVRWIEATVFQAPLKPLFLYYSCKLTTDLRLLTSGIGISRIKAAWQSICRRFIEREHSRLSEHHAAFAQVPAGRQRALHRSRSSSEPSRAKGPERVCSLPPPASAREPGSMLPAVRARSCSWMVGNWLC